MYRFVSGGYFVEQPVELPRFDGDITNVIIDFETSSGDPSIAAFNTWHNCTTAGIAISVDNSPTYYVPYKDFDEAGKLVVRAWLQSILSRAKYWINQNVKYDMNVAVNDLKMVLNPKMHFVCTIVLAKLVNSDRWDYDLTALCRDYLGVDITPFENRLKPYLVKNKDYGRIPSDILGEYACVDVQSVIDLFAELYKQLPEECFEVWGTEIRTTWRLFQGEQRGLHADKREIMITQAMTINRLLEIDNELMERVGYAFRPHVNNDVYGVLCNTYGLPIIEFTKDEDGEETETASFNKKVLKKYLTLPNAPVEVVRLMLEYRELEQFNNLFLEPWQSLLVAEALHANYNQCVRTGRMSCSQPNAQQLSGRAKKLIKPRPGYKLISIDFSQIEFRYIVHYIQDKRAIQTFIDNPDADFHDLVAAWCGIARKPAKSVNFGIAFGEGKKKLIAELLANEDVAEAVKLEVMALLATNRIREDQIQTAFEQIGVRKGTGIYNTYHATFPTMKSTMRAAEGKIRQRGYIRNWYGRHRRLPVKAAFRAFNTINQSSAADLMKERMCDLLDAIEGLDIHLLAVVHDEILLEARADIADDPRVIRDLVAIMESPARPISVPIRCSVGVSALHWKDASSGVKDGGQSAPLSYNKADARRFEYLKQHAVSA